MNRVFDSVFGRHFQPVGRIRSGYVYPPTNVRETDDAYTVQCEVPGLEMADLEVYVTGDQLTVSGSRTSTVPEEEVTLHRRERDAGGSAGRSRCPVRWTAAGRRQRSPTAS